MRLFSQDGRHHKVDKNLNVKVFSVILHLAPANQSGYEVCPMRSAGCTAACLNTAGFAFPHPRIPNITRKQNARVERTKWFFEQRPHFMAQLVREIYNAKHRAKKLGYKCGVRLNGTSDIVWENVPAEGAPNVMTLFPDVAFMDYTKRHNRKNLPANYRLLFSRSEDNLDHCIAAIRNGMNVAVVFRDKLPETYALGPYNLRVIDGDVHDWRYGDYDDYPNERVVVGLSAKGKARYDETGFVVNG